MSFHSVIAVTAPQLVQGSRLSQQGFSGLRTALVQADGHDLGQGQRGTTASGAAGSWCLDFKAHNLSVCAVVAAAVARGSCACVCWAAWLAAAFCSV